MKNNPKISIIMPIYKTEKYLRHCVVSILNQTYNNFELILVENGSPDRCSEICEELKTTDPRIQVIHKEHGSIADARNAGIEIAKGEYLAFVDSDDYIASDMYERLYKNLINNNAQISMCCAYNIYDEDMELYSCKEGKKYIFKSNEILNALYSKRLDNFVWNKLYRRQLFDTIRYPNKTYEDLFTMYRLLDLCDTVVLDTTQLYYYRVRKDSVMGTARKVINTDKFIAYADMEEYFKDRPIKNMVIQYMKNDLMSDVFKIIAAQMFNENKQFFYELKKFVKNHKLQKTKVDIVLWLAIHALWVLKLRYKVQRKFK